MARASRRKTMNFIGSWAFLIGVVLAVIFGLLGSVEGMLVTLLVFLGIVVGLLNITSDETQPFLLSGLALILASAFGQQAVIAISLFENVLSALLLVFVPATIVVAIKNVFVLARR